MQTPASLSPTPGPLERTSAELVRLARSAAFRQAQRRPSRDRLEQADELVGLLEECRLKGHRLLPSGIWAHIVRFIGGVDPHLRDELGINRHIDRVSEVLFSAQAELMDRSMAERAPFRAQVIPLFADQALPVAGV